MRQVILLVLMWVQLINWNLSQLLAEPSLYLNPELTFSELQNIAFSRTWLALLHYKKNFWGKYESQVDGNTFFLNKNGKYDPLAELISTINNFTNNGKTHCRFPARYKFLSKRLNISFPDKPCNDLNNFLKKIKTKTLSIIYSSYYLNNPASIFGHTFIKLKSHKSELLDQSINFTAKVDNESSLTYIFKGFSGYFPGYYSLVPFYEKVKEYNDYENRDLWIYHLSFKEDEIDTFLKHIWELKQTHYDYYFLSENCAYHTLSTLEPVIPGKKLNEKTEFPVIPINIIKIINRNGLVKSIEYKPSLYNIFLYNYKTLDEHQSNLFHSFIDNVHNTSFAQKLDTQTLSTLIDYMNYKHPAISLNILEDIEDRKIFNTKKKLNIILSQRTHSESDQLAEIRPQPELFPHTIHNTHRISVRTGKSSCYQASFFQPEIRLLFHDINDSDRGYSNSSEIEALKITGDILLNEEKNQNNFFMREFTLLKITSFNDFTFYSKKPSWSLYIGGSRFFDERTDNRFGTFAPHTTFSIGFSKNNPYDSNLSKTSLKLFTMINTDIAYSKNFNEKKFSPGCGPSLGIMLSIFNDLMITYALDYYKYLERKNIIKSSVTLRFQFIKNMAFDLNYIKTKTYNEINGGFLYYY